jgi:hypothetical protein
VTAPRAALAVGVLLLLAVCTGGPAWASDAAQAPSVLSAPQVPDQVVPEDVAPEVLEDVAPEVLEDAEPQDGDAGDGPAPEQVAPGLPPTTSGDLPQPPVPRRYGLPVALALVGLLGAGSLLVRVLLAEPVEEA